MPLGLPIFRDVTVSEKRVYTIRYDFCTQGSVPTSQYLFAKAYPRYSYPAEAQAFFDKPYSAPSTVPVRRFFSPGDALWRRTGSRLGKATPFQPELQWAVYTPAPEVTLPVTISGYVITVTIPFGPSFTRFVNDNGSVSQDDSYPENDPVLYHYAVANGGLQFAGGSIKIAIDLSVVTPTTPATPATLCSVEVT
jgi:hypothetical protein